MDFETFGKLILSGSAIEYAVALEPSTTLFEDLGLDSLQVLELLDDLDRIEGYCESETFDEPLNCLGDLYNHYCNSLTG